MAQSAPRTHTDAATLALLEQRAVALRDEAIVRLTLEDGRVLEGTVAVKPTLQVFRDAGGTEGHNGLLRLDDAHDPAISHPVWLDEIATIEQLGTA